MPRLLTPPSSCRSGGTQAGFTLIELVLVIVITAAVATMALPKLMDTGAWRMRAFSDELLSLAQQGRRMALSQRRPVLLTITTTGARLTYVSGGSLGQVDCPSGIAQCIAATGSGTVTFNSGNSGSTVTSTGASLTLVLSDNASYSRTLRIETETGLIQALS